MSEHELFATASSLNYDQIGIEQHRKTLKFEFQTIQQVPDPIDPDKIKHTVENETLVVSGPAVEQLETIFARKAYRESKATGFYKITNTEPSCKPGPVKSI